MTKPPPAITGQVHETLHASCVVVGERGLLIMGPSGIGKSAAALLMTQVLAPRARLLGDDRIRVAAHHGRVIARPHPLLAGAIEQRGSGIARVSHHQAAVVALVLKLTSDYPERHPDERAQTIEVAGLTLPCVSLAGGVNLAVSLPASWAMVCTIMGN